MKIFYGKVNLMRLIKAFPNNYSPCQLATAKHLNPAAKLIRTICSSLRIQHFFSSKRPSGRQSANRI